MNEYRITYEIEKAEGVAYQTTVLALTKQAAFKVFKKNSEGIIKAIDLIRMDAPATRDQEREALEKIKAIVATLGPDSYVAVAFDGCFRDAEDNIEDDAAYSMKDRYESTAKKLRQEIEEHQATKKELEKARRACREAEDNVDYLGKKLEAAQGKAIPLDLWNAIYGIVKDRVVTTTELMADAAELMADLAGASQDDAFAAAVEKYQRLRARKGWAENVLGRLEAIAPDGAEF